MNPPAKRPAGVSRRRFVAVLAAGSAALLARPAAAAVAATKPRSTATARRPAAPALTPAQRREYDRQRAATLETLKVIRTHPMPPGTEMASVFRVRRSGRKGR